jgi:hypothetical protein
VFADNLNQTQVIDITAKGVASPKYGPDIADFGDFVANFYEQVYSKGVLPAQLPLLLTSCRQEARQLLNCCC